MGLRIAAINGVVIEDETETEGQEEQTAEE